MGICRTWSVALAATLAFSGASAQKPSLPMRNLLVEVRQTQDEAGEQITGVTGGSVTIRSDGTIQGGARASVTTRSRDAAGQAVQQLMVLNGGRGSIRLSQAVPYQFARIVVTPRGIEATPATVWHDSGTGFIVQPRWPGGTQPATVELSAEAGATQLLTTVQLPLGDWVTIARSAAESDTSGGRFALQMRISVR